MKEAAILRFFIVTPAFYASKIAYLNDKMRRQIVSQQKVTTSTYTIIDR